MSETLRPEALDALAEVGNIGAGTAATALSQMTGARIDLGVPRVSLVPVEDVPARVGGDDTTVVAVLLEVTGDAPGRVVIMIPVSAAHALVATLMGQPPPEPDAALEADFDELALSALQEVGNVLTSAYLGALSSFTGLMMEPTPPAVGVDMAFALLADAVVDVAETSGQALLIETDFADTAEPTAGALLYIPTPAALEAVLERLGLGAVAS